MIAFAPNQVVLA